jgi:hypothetical protein
VRLAQLAAEAFKMADLFLQLRAFTPECLRLAWVIPDIRTLQLGAYFA